MITPVGICKHSGMNESEKEFNEENLKMLKLMPNV